MGDTFGIVGADQSLIQQLSFLVRHIRDQQTEEYVELLDFGGQFGELDSRPVQKLADRPIHLADLHHIDAVRAGRGNLDKLPAYIGTGTVEFVPFQRRNDENGNVFPPHS